MRVTEAVEHYKKHDYFPVGKGWRPFVEKLIEDIAKIAPDTEITQIKEKFGTLRFYCSGDGSDDIFELISKAEQLSGITCEECGTTENVTTEGGWIKTLCKKCKGM